jgi:hypothetical protein
MMYVRLTIIILALLLDTCAINAEATIRLVASADPGNKIVYVEGIEKEDLRALQSASADRLVEFFKLTIDGSTPDSELPPVLGNSALENDCLIFRPRFPLIAGQLYRAEFRSPSTRETIRRSLTFEKALPSEPSRVLAIYPSASQLPRNVLRFYLHFSAPMQQGKVYQHLLLTKVDGTRLNAPFLEVAEELWDPSGTRLTLLFDPGRVKQGLVPRDEDGAIFEIGTAYRFTVQSTWLDAQGRGLASIATKEFSVVEDDFVQPNPSNWQLHPPVCPDSKPSSSGKQSTTDVLSSALYIDVSETLDQALFQRCIKVFNPKMELIAGEVEIANEERRWIFRPQSTWESGTYTLKIDDVLEDVAGNSIARPFEVDMTETRRAPVPVTTLRFTVP